MLAVLGIMIGTSSVPPQKSMTAMRSSCPNRSSPYASDAAVGSFTKRAVESARAAQSCI
jgi:hypothetical protein